MYAFGIYNFFGCVLRRIFPFSKELAKTHSLIYNGSVEAWEFI